jgi:hypothetical protein
VAQIYCIVVKLIKKKKKKEKLNVTSILWYHNQSEHSFSISQNLSHPQNKTFVFTISIIKLDLFWYWFLKIIFGNTTKTRLRQKFPMILVTSTAIVGYFFPKSANVKITKHCAKPNQLHVQWRKETPSCSSKGKTTNKLK